VVGLSGCNILCLNYVLGKIIASPGMAIVYIQKEQGNECRQQQQIKYFGITDSWHTAKLVFYWLHKFAAFGAAMVQPEKDSF
jgi:hypothetical protein